MDNIQQQQQQQMDRQVILEGGLPWGFRIQGGVDTGFPLRIARVTIAFVSNQQACLFVCLFVCLFFAPISHSFNI